MRTLNLILAFINLLCVIYNAFLMGTGDSTPYTPLLIVFNGIATILCAGASGYDLGKRG